MKIIYVPVAKKIKEKNLKNYIKCFLYDVSIILRNFSLNKKVTKNTSGYIESAIYSNAKIFEAPYGFCIFFSRILNVIFDGIFINWKFTNYREDENIDIKLIKLSEKFNIKKVRQAFSYNSAENLKFLTINEIRELIKKNISKDFKPV